jgi:hypothetical protein
MKDFCDLASAELLALGRRALELESRRLDEIAAASDPGDRPLRELLHKMALESELRASEVEREENIRPEDAPLATSPDLAMKLISGYLKSLTKSFGEGPLLRDAALFFAESLEEETSRLCRVLAQHAREWPINRLFIDLAERERHNVDYLREVVLAG